MTEVAQFLASWAESWIVTSRAALGEAAGDDEAGQGMVEYGLILGLVAIAAVVALVAIGGKVNTTFTNVNTKLPTPIP